MSTATEPREAAWQNPFFMAAFFCIALAVGLLWQSAQIDADAQMMIEQLRLAGPPSLIDT